MGRMSKMTWLLGHWTGREGDGQTEAIWSLEDEKCLVGLGRTRVNGQTVHQERMRIEQAESGWMYHFIPEGRPEMRFQAVTIEDGLMVFENLGGGFPHRLQYQRTDTTLTALIEDATGERQMSWIWQRTQTD